MDTTPNLALPYILPAQAQKHVTHNEALIALDAVVMLAAIDRDLSARLEDSEGWPLTAPGPLKSLDIKLEPGKYRLVTPPIDVDARMVARLMAITPDVALEGHGPHKLGYDDEYKLQWREPQSKDAPRLPVSRGTSRSPLPSYPPGSVGASSSQKGGSPGSMSGSPGSFGYAAVSGSSSREVGPSRVLHAPLPTLTGRSPVDVSLSASKAA